MQSIRGAPGTAPIGLRRPQLFLSLPDEAGPAVPSSCRAPGWYVVNVESDGDVKLGSRSLHSNVYVYDFPSSFFSLGEVGLREESSSASGTTSTAKYRCPDCGGSYSSKFSLKAHLQTHRRELAFRCHHCGRHFEREEERLAHIRQLHAPRPHIKGRLQSMTKKKKGHSTPGATSSGLSPASRAPSMSAPGVCR